MSILIVGDFPSARSLAAGGPFEDGLWRFYKSQMQQAGIRPSDCEWLTVLQTPADGRGLFSYLGPKADATPGTRKVLQQGARHLYLLSSFTPQIEAFRESVRALSPTLIIAVGDLALWATTEEPSLDRARGRITRCSFLPSTKVLPTFPPGITISSGQNIPILFADLSKARVQSTFPGIRRPERTLWLRPTLEDLPLFEQTHLPEGSEISVDIETKTGAIACIGFAPSSSIGLVVPFFDEDVPSGNYWEHGWQEVQAWRWVRHILTSPLYTTFGQNFTFDATYLIVKMGIPPVTWADDTMLMHHALQIEMKKGLGFLASLYSDEIAWKHMLRKPASDRARKKGDDE